MNRLSSFSLRSRTTGWIQASISGVIVPGPPKMFSGTQPGVGRAHRRIAQREC